MSQTVVVTGAEELLEIRSLEDALAESLDVPVTILVEHIPSVVIICSDADGEVRTEVVTDP